MPPTIPEGIPRVYTLGLVSLESPGAGTLRADAGRDHEGDARRTAASAGDWLQHDQADHQGDAPAPGHQGAERRRGQPAQREQLQA